MPLDFAALRTEFFARGFDYLNDGASGLVRAKRFINDAMHEIDEMDDWAYLLATASGVAPLVVADVKKIESVVDTTNVNRLVQATRGEITDWYADLTTVGFPQFWYMTGATTLATYPVSTSLSLTVTYSKFGPDLVNDTDAPLMPDRFRYAIVEYAVAHALLDDEAGDAEIARAAGDRIIDRMRQSQLVLAPTATVMPAVGDDC